MLIASKSIRRNWFNQSISFHKIFITFITYFSNIQLQSNFESYRINVICRPLPCNQFLLNSSKRKYLSNIKSKVQIRDEELIILLRWKNLWNLNVQALRLTSWTVHSLYSKYHWYSYYVKFCNAVLSFLKCVILKEFFCFSLTFSTCWSINE